jgi:hypothetical protein
MDKFDAELRKSALRPPYVEIRHTNSGKNLGVYALRNFRAGEVVEYAVLMMFGQRSKVLREMFKCYVFNMEKLSNKSGDALALGYGSLYNSANPANMRYEYVDAPRPLLKFVAVRDITKGQELSVNYSGENGSHESVGNPWFEEKGIDYKK